MINEHTIQYYKEQYNGHKIIYVRFLNNDFLFRTLTVKEYEMLSKMYSNEFKLETAICNLSCLYPESYEFSECEFGVFPSVISGYIKKASAFDEPEDIFIEYDNSKSNYNLYQQCMDLIKAFIKDYTYEEMEEWTWQKLMEMTVRAENIAKLQGFDYHLERAENMEEISRKPSIKNEDDVNKLLENRINPLIFFKDEIQKELDKNKEIISEPFIIGPRWNNKEILDGFRNKKNKESNTR